MILWTYLPGEVLTDICALADYFSLIPSCAYLVSTGGGGGSSFCPPEFPPSVEAIRSELTTSIFTWMTRYFYLEYICEWDLPMML
jgi:hypothetical protein